MRLTCPNCDAQYMVPDDAIPETGREVQCSNCAKTWFQRHDAHSRPTTGADDVAQSDEPDARERDTGHAAPPQREIDPAVASVLREEAERERRARAAAQKSLQAKTNPSPGDAPAHTTDAMEQAPPKVGRATAARDEGDPAPAARPSLYPDMDAVKDAAAPEPEPVPDPQPAAPAFVSYSKARPAPARRGFWRGFLLAVLIALALLLIYVFALPLADTMPPLRGLLADYVALVDGVRQWLDAQVTAAMIWFVNVTAPAPVGG